MRAVHFGAGNIGRGFVGLLLHEGGYEVVFADVNAELIGAIAAADSYTVHEVGDGAKDTVVTGFRAAPAVFDAIVTPLMRAGGLSRDEVENSPGNVLSPVPEGEAVHGRWGRHWMRGVGLAGAAVGAGTGIVRSVTTRRS